MMEKGMNFKDKYKMIYKIYSLFSNCFFETANLTLNANIVTTTPNIIGIIAITQAVLIYFFVHKKYRIKQWSENVIDVETIYFIDNTLLMLGNNTNPEIKLIK